MKKILFALSILSILSMATFAEHHAGNNQEKASGDIKIQGKAATKHTLSANKAFAKQLNFADEDQQAKSDRDPVAPAERSAAAIAKVRSKQLPDGSPAHSFQSLLRNLATTVRNTCQFRDTEAGAPAFTIDTRPTSTQQKAFQLLKKIRV